MQRKKKTKSSEVEGMLAVMMVNMAADAITSSNSIS